MSNLLSVLEDWIAQKRPDIAAYYTKTKGTGYKLDVYNLGVLLNWNAAKQSNLKNQALLQKVCLKKDNSCIVTDLEGKRWQQFQRGKPFVELVPKRKLSQAAALKNRYRRGLITIPRQIKKMEESIAEQKLELPILVGEANRVYNSLIALMTRFETEHDIKVKAYPYHQSIIRFASKYGADKFTVMHEEFWQIRRMRVRLEDLNARQSHIGRYVRRADLNIAKAKDRQKKLTHGQDPNKALPWEKKK